MDAKFAELYKTVWAYTAKGAERIKAQYLEAGGFRRTAAGAPRSDPDAFLAAIEQITAPTTILYGYQDYEPITQAYIVQQRIRHAQIRFINECSHCPWVDQPMEFERMLLQFVSD